MHLSGPTQAQAAVQRGKNAGTELEIHFSFEGFKAYSVMPAANLAALLNNSPDLKDIRMYHVGLEGDLQPVLEALRQCTRLQFFLAQCCHFNPAQMASTLAELPLLEHLIIVGHYFSEGGEAGRIPMAGVTRLLSRNTLKVLELNPMGSFASIEDAASFFEAVNHSTNLKSLWCLSEFTDAYVKLVECMIRENNSLTNFKISIAPGVSLLPIAKALAVNTNLLGLDIKLEATPVVSDLECFHEVMETSNYTLKKLQVAKETQWSDEDNTYVPIYQDKKVKEAAEKLDFYLSLNRAGRHLLLADRDQAATPDDWLDAIADNQDLSVVFYFVRRNPFLGLPRSLGGIIPAPTPESTAKEKAKQAAKYSSLYPFGGMEGMQLCGLKDVQAALEDPNPRPVTNIRIEFDFRHPGQAAPVLQASDLAAIIRRQPSSLTSLMFYFVTVEGDFQQVLEALHKHQALQYFFAQGSKFDANGLVHTLWDMPNFNSLTLSGSEATMANLTTLMRKRSMKSLLVSGIPVATDKEIAEFFEAAEKSPGLEKLDCMMRSSYLTTAHLVHVGKFLRNHDFIKTLEIIVAREASLIPIAESLEHNTSLTRLIITVDGISTHNPFINWSDITSFRDALATKNATLKTLKVCQESWHGDHLWKPEYARDDVTKECLQLIEEYLALNSKGRSLPEGTDVKDDTEKQALKKEIQELKDRLERLERQINQHHSAPAVQGAKPKWRMFKRSKAKR